MNALLHSRFAETLGWTLLHSLWQLAALAAVWTLGLVALRRAAASTRYVVASVGLLLMLAAPIATYAYLLPPPPALPLAVTRADVPSEDIHVTLSTSAASAHEGGPVVVLPPPAPTVLPLAARIRHVLTPYLPAATAFYLLGAALMLLRLLAGYAGLRRIIGSAMPLHGRAAAQLADIAGRMGLSRTIRLLQSAAVEVPTLIGALQPVILLPAAALTGLSPSQLVALLAHEIAHIRRHDYVANLIQSLIDTLLFYHPAAWWLSARIRAERELCCDDAAIAATHTPLDYARALAAMESLRAPTPLALAARGTGPLLTRIRRILAAKSAATASAPARQPRRIVSTASAALLVTLIALTTYIGCNKSPAPAASSASQSAPSPTPITATGTSVCTYDMRYLAEPDMDLSGNGGLIFSETRAARLEALVNQIKSTIAPDTWTDHGGTLGSITENIGCLTVTQSPENQAAVSQALEEEFTKHGIAVQIDVQSLLVATNFMDDFRIGWNAPVEVGESNPKLYTGTSIIDDWTLNLLRTSTGAAKTTITMPHQTISVPPLSPFHLSLLPADFGGPVVMTGLSFINPDRSRVRIEPVLLTGIVGKPLSNPANAPQLPATNSNGVRAELPSTNPFQVDPPAIPTGGALLIDGGTVIFNRDGASIQRHLLTLIQPKIIHDADALRQIFAATSTTDQSTTQAAAPATQPQPQANQVLIKSMLIEADADAFAKAWEKADPNVHIDDPATVGNKVGLSTPDLQKAVQDLIASKQAEILSRPYLLANDEEQATMTIGQQVPYIQNHPDNGPPDIHYITTGIQLEVRPHLHNISVPGVSPTDRAVMLDVNASLTNLVKIDDVPAPNAQPGDPTIQVPVLDKRQASSSILIGNDQTVLMLLQPAKQGKIDILFLTPHINPTPP